ncbi:hypothetical protein [Niabella beijingensis]|uniref:hypothetical protein n=1 Tax=Niabella beijingensis TaxID=2872700 RepID=UPI001CBCDA13|nr:hypothetical protein [Niabella beijingensis]MBZ4192582.1 hypothetical protein [Niabella beijingensis]
MNRNRFCKRYKSVLNGAGRNIFIGELTVPVIIIIVNIRPAVMHTQKLSYTNTFIPLLVLLKMCH